MTQSQNPCELELSVFNKVNQSSTKKYKTNYKKLKRITTKYFKSIGIQVTFILNNPRRNPGVRIFTNLQSHSNLDFVPSA